MSVRVRGRVRGRGRCRCRVQGGQGELPPTVGEEEHA